MSEPRNEPPGATPADGDEPDGRPAPSVVRAAEPRGIGSSLTDAVVAALANVSQPPPSRSTPPAASATGESKASFQAAKVTPTLIAGGAEPAPQDPPPSAASSDRSSVDATLPDANVIERKASGATDGSDGAIASAGAADAPAGDVAGAVLAAAASGGVPSEDASSAGDAAGAGDADAERAGAESAQPSASEATAAGASVADDAARDDATERVPSADVTPSVPSADATEPGPSADATERVPTADATDSESSEPTVRVGGAPVEHLTPESAEPAPEGIVVQYYGRTDVGLVREHNEDNFLVADLSTERRGLGESQSILKTTLGTRGLVLAVCDGMGGAAAGEVASQMAVDTVYEIMQAGGPPRDRDQLARRLVRAIEEAGARIFSAAKMDRTRRGMGTTSTVAALVDSTIFVGNVGDSRAYVLRGDQFALISKDQSLVNQLIEAGQLTEEEAEAFEHSNIILQALGTTEEVTVDLTFLELRRGDRLLMCSDGLSGLVHAEMMKDVLRSTDDLSEAAQQLIAMANAGGGHDNITIILAELDGAGLREATADARVAYQQYPLPPEDPSQAEVLPPRPTGMKSGGPKPGADVKGEGARAAASIAEPASSSRWWVAGVVLLVILVSVAALIMMMDDGDRAGAASPDDETTRVTIASTVSTRPGSAAPATGAAEPEAGAILVTTDVEGGVLFVDGQQHADALSSGVVLRLPAGEHRLEVREGDVRVAERVVTLAAGEEERVDLSMPAGQLPEPGMPALGETGETGETGALVDDPAATSDEPLADPGEGVDPPEEAPRRRRGGQRTQRGTGERAPAAAAPATEGAVPAAPGQVL